MSRVGPPGRRGHYFTCYGPIHDLPRSASVQDLVHLVEFDVDAADLFSDYGAEPAD